jgi:adenylate cyclase
MMPSWSSVADPTAPCRSCGRPGRGCSGQPGRPPHPERRTVTVLFVDIVGFTTLVDDLEPEEVRDLQCDYFAVVAGIIRTWHGVVEKYIGDAVMAVFGAGAGRDDQNRDGAGDRDASGDRAGQCDGDHAYRAVQAGLAVQDALAGRALAGRFVVRARVGAATGEAVVDHAGFRDGGQAMISGRVVALAARLQAYAPDGTVVVCEFTRHATAAEVAYQDLPPIAIAGRPRPIDLWRALPRGTHPVIMDRVSGFRRRILMHTP